MIIDLLPELKSYLNRKRWTWRPVDNENIAIKTCPFCGKSKHKFYVHAKKAVYQCWHCKATGNLYKLKRELGDLGNSTVSAAQAAGAKGKDGKKISMKAVEKMHKRLLRHEKTLRYLKETRGFTDETIAYFKLGIQKQNGRLWLAIPHIVNDICHNIKFRSLPPNKKDFRRIKGCSSVLFNSDALATYNQIVIAEAETDAMSLWQAGIKNVIGLTGGAGTFLPEWYDILADKEEIVIALDADTPGQEGAREIARRLGFDKCKNVLLPYHDANEMLIQVGPDELKRSFESAELFEVGGIIKIFDALDHCKLDSATSADGLLTPWDSVNQFTGGWRMGDLIVLSAKIKIGKSTWALNIADYLAGSGLASLVYCLEMSVERLAQKITALHRNKPSDMLSGVDYELTRYYLKDRPLYFVEPDWSGSFKLENVLSKIKESVKRHGIKFMVFDHLHFLCRSLQYVTTEVGQVTRAFKLLAQELDIVIMLIAQPKKIDSSRVIKYDDIKDSSSIPADADQIILLHRKSRAVGLDKADVQASDQEVLEAKTLVRIDAARFKGGGECFLYYDGACSKFYDWDDRPEQAIKKL